MTKLEELINEYYATEGLSLRDHINEMSREMDVHEFATELVDLLHHLNKKIK